MVFTNFYIHLKKYSCFFKHLLKCNGWRKYQSVLINRFWSMTQQQQLKRNQIKGLSHFLFLEFSALSCIQTFNKGFLIYQNFPLWALVTWLLLIIYTKLIKKSFERYQGIETKMMEEIKGQKLIHSSRCKSFWLIHFQAKRFCKSFFILNCCKGWLPVNLVKYLSQR